VVKGVKGRRVKGVACLGEVGEVGGAEVWGEHSERASLRDVRRGGKDVCE
jgi:hypothetical protein